MIVILPVALLAREAVVPPDRTLEPNPVPPPPPVTVVKLKPPEPLVVSTCPAVPSVIPKFKILVGIDGLPDRSEYEPLVATVANVGFPVTFVQVRLDYVIKPAPLVN